jgi:hypothetical protein
VILATLPTLDESGVAVRQIGGRDPHRGIRESRLEGGGVNRANLKFTNLITTTSRVSVRNINESERGCRNKLQANKECDTRICFTEVRFLQTYSPLRWSQRPGLFQPFPSLKRSLGPSELLFSINLNTKFPQGPPHDWCLLP